MTPPRVLQVVLSLDPGGTERLVLDLVRRLNSSVPMAVCCLDEAGAWAGALADEGISVTALGRRPGFHPALGLGVARAAAAHRATLMHAHHYTPFVYSALARVRRPAVKAVFTEHGRLSDAGPSPRRRWANQAFRHLATSVFTVSNDVKQHLVDEGFRPAQIEVIYNGIDVGDAPDAMMRAAVRQELGVDDAAMVIGTVARLDPVKDLDTLVRALALLRTKNVLLLIVGDGPRRAELARLATDLDVAPRVRFLGHREDARRCLAGCDVYVNSSISEGVSLTILEAMAAGLPVIATRVGGTPEVIDHSCGLLVEARDPAALADGLDRLFQDAAARRRLGDRARHVVVERFGLDAMVERYRQVYVG